MACRGLLNYVAADTMALLLTSYLLQEKLFKIVYRIDCFIVLQIKNNNNKLWDVDCFRAGGHGKSRIDR